MLHPSVSDVRCKYWQLQVNDGQIEPILGAAGSFLATFGSVAMGHGDAVAVSTKDLYEAGRKADLTGSEVASVSSINNGKDDVEIISINDHGNPSEYLPTPSKERIHKQRTLVDDRTPKPDYGLKGLGKAAKAML